MPEKQKSHYSSRQAAELLGVAVSTIQLWTNNGLLRAWTTAGGHRRIERSSIEEILAQQQATMSVTQNKPSLSAVIVEDNPQQRLLYKKQLAARHIEMDINTAKNGYEGLIKIGRNLPDIIITDLMMPEMDGFQMVRAIKELPELEHCLIIVVTALNENEVDARGGLPEGVHLFTKPVPFEELEILLQQQAQIKAA